MDLDDFFAKKDKKKGKSKKSFVSSELKVLEQPVVKEKEQNKVVEESNNETAANEDNDDEWREFEESKRPDYSNLKLGQLTLDEEQQNQNNAGNENEYDMTYNEGDNNGENPWKKVSQGQKETGSAPAAAPNSSKSGIYVAFTGDSAKARKKNAPDLNNENYFPSLGTEKPIEPIKKKDGFEEVKHGVKKGSQATLTSNPVSIGNTYSSLFNNNDIES